MMDLAFIPQKIYKSLNIKFFQSKIKSQIYQRNYAIHKASSDYILQIDDDVTIEQNFFLKIKKYTLNKHLIQKKIISALIIQKNGNLQAGSWNSIYRKYFLFKLLLKILNKGKKIEEYSILESGRCVPYIKNFNGQLANNNGQLSTVVSHIDS